mmetsp:Transcript_12809/g.49070  ORF Transcript_12809/g.49070 Transcript_12809/m.49070 type:complete len:338 (+) Transcript_12809:895-1908(+)
MSLATGSAAAAAAAACGLEWGNGESASMPGSLLPGGGAIRMASSRARRSLATSEWRDSASPGPSISVTLLATESTKVEPCVAAVVQSDDAPAVAEDQKAEALLVTVRAASPERTWSLMLPTPSERRSARRAWRSRSAATAAEELTTAAPEVTAEERKDHAWAAVWASASSLSALLSRVGRDGAELPMPDGAPAPRPTRRGGALDGAASPGCHMAAASKSLMVDSLGAGSPWRRQRMRSRYHAAAALLYLFAIGSSMMPCRRKKSCRAWLPPTFMASIWASFQASICTDRTKLMWTPRPRCRPAQSRHSSVPNETDAHCGLGVKQSTQAPLPGMAQIS